MENNNFYCSGCAVKNNYPDDCSNCPNLTGAYHKYNSLLRNYNLLINNANNNKDSVINKITDEIKSASFK